MSRRAGAALRVAVIGAGAMGRNHCRVYNELPGAELVGVADADPATAERAGRSFHAPLCHAGRAAGAGAA